MLQGEGEEGPYLTGEVPPEEEEEERTEGRISPEDLRRGIARARGRGAPTQEAQRAGPAPEAPRLAPSARAAAGAGRAGLGALGAGGGGAAGAGAAAGGAAAGAAAGGAAAGAAAGGAAAGAAAGGAAVAAGAATAPAWLPIVAIILLVIVVIVLIIAIVFLGIGFAFNSRLGRGSETDAAYAGLLEPLPAGFFANGTKVALADLVDFVMTNDNFAGSAYREKEGGVLVIEQFYRAASRHQINPVGLLAISINESNWGRSDCHKRKRNLFSYGMSDRLGCEGSDDYPSYLAGFNNAFKSIKKHYLLPEGSYYYDEAKIEQNQNERMTSYIPTDGSWQPRPGTLLDKANFVKDYTPDGQAGGAKLDRIEPLTFASMNIKYASDVAWAYKAGIHVNTILNFLRQRGGG